MDILNCRPEVEALLNKGWDALHKSDQLKHLLAADKEAFRELYKTKYGVYPNETPLPAGVSGNLAADMQRMPGVSVPPKMAIKW